MTIREKMNGPPVAGFFTGSGIAPVGEKDRLRRNSGVLAPAGG